MVSNLGSTWLLYITGMSHWLIDLWFGSQIHRQISFFLFLPVLFSLQVYRFTGIYFPWCQHRIWNVTINHLGTNKWAKRKKQMPLLVYVALNLSLNHIFSHICTFLLFFSGTLTFVAKVYWLHNQYNWIVSLSVDILNLHV